MALSLAQLRDPPTQAEQLTTIIDNLDALGFNASSWQAGSVQRDFMELLALLTVQLAESAKVIAELAYNELATGAALTEFSASMYDHTRLAATRTVGDIVLVDAASTGPHVIAVGSLVVSDTVNGFTYRNTTGGTLLLGDTLTLAFQAEVAGADRNVANNTITNLNTPIAGVTVNNPPAVLTSTWITSEGSDGESDASLRTRNRSRWGLLNIAVPTDGYISIALGVDNVARATVDDTNPRGPGTVDVYIAGATGTSSPGDVTAVQTAVDARRPVSADVDVFAAAVFNVTIAGVIHVQASLLDAAKEAEIEQAARDVINALPIGGQILPPSATGVVPVSELIGAMTAVEGVDSVALTSPTANIPLTFAQVAVLFSFGVTFTAS